MAVEHWLNNNRSDGLEIREAIEGWVILPAGDQAPIIFCPCCDQLMKTLWEAQRVADAVVPLRLA